MTAENNTENPPVPEKAKEMPSPADNNKRIAKNTLYMYVRMLAIVLVSLFTVRVVFRELGEDNYGIYNLVAGVIVFFSFLNSGLTAATRRYINTELATGTIESQRHVFNTCVVAHILIAAVVLLLGETAGLWFVCKMLNIPDGRLGAAIWVYQFTIVSAVVGVMQAPYNAAIVAHERMNVFAYISILDVALKLCVAWLVCLLPGDVLINYGALVLCAILLTALVYRTYCWRHFPDTRWQYRRDVPLLRQVFGFMSWSVLGQLAVVGANQGVSVLVNLYTSVAVNAAIGVSNQIVNVANNFVVNFQTAFNPQIIKSYANGEYAYLKSLMLRASKLSSYLIILFLVPVMFECPRLLHLWLGDYPTYAVEFCILTLFAIYLDAIAAPLWMLSYARKEIRTYQLVLSSIYALTFFGAWLVLGIGLVPYAVVGVRIVVYAVMLAVRFFFARRILPSLKGWEWFSQVVLRSLAIIVGASAVTWAVSTHLSAAPILHIAVTASVSTASVLLLAFFIGLNRHEREVCVAQVRKKLKR